jgi:Uma2 family endonuclease
MATAAALQLLSQPQKLVAPRTPKLYSLEQYLAREERSVTKNEFYNGIIKPMAGGKYRHNKIASNVLVELDLAVRGLKKYYEVINSDQKVYIIQANLALYPDALVICEKPEFWNGDTTLLVNPLLIVEIASKSTRSYDRGEKFLLYETLPTFKEYVLIEQNKQAVEVWFRQDEDTWKKSKTSGLETSILLRSLDVELALKDVYRGISFEN